MLVSSCIHDGVKLYFVMTEERTSMTRPFTGTPLQFCTPAAPTTMSANDCLCLLGVPRNDFSVMQECSGSMDPLFIAASIIQPQLKIFVQRSAPPSAKQNALHMSNGLGCNGSLAVPPPCKCAFSSLELHHFSLLARSTR